MPKNAAAKSARTVTATVFVTESDSVLVVDTRRGEFRDQHAPAIYRLAADVAQAVNDGAPEWKATSAYPEALDGRFVIEFGCNAGRLRVGAATDAMIKLAAQNGIKAKKA